MRPLRIGFLVDPRDREMLSDVVRLATCLWGGAACPMIPVMQSLPTSWKADYAPPTPAQVTEGLLRFFEPDLVVETAAGQLDRAGLATDAVLDRRRHFTGLDTLLKTEPGRRTDLNVGLGMHHVYSHLFQTEFQYERRNPHPIFHFAGGDPAGRTFFEVCYGLFPDRAEIEYIQAAYQQALDAETVAPDINTWCKLEEKQASGPFDVTLHGTERQFLGGWDEAIFVFDPLDGPDVVDFWNARLFRRDLVPVNVHWLEASRDLIVDFIRRNYRPMPSNPNGVMIRTTIQAARSLDAEAMIKTLRLNEVSLPQGSFVTQHWYNPIWDTPADQHAWQPATSPLSADTRNVQVSVDDSGTIRIPQLSPPYVRSTRGSGPAWVNTIASRFYGMNGRLAEVMPSAAVHRDRRYPPPGLMDQTPTREGWLVFHRFAHDSQFLHFLKMDVAITAWLASKGIESISSDAGRIADRMIDAVDGLNGTRLLAHEAVVRQLDKMARSRTEHADGSAEEYPDRTATFGQLRRMLQAISEANFGQSVTLKRFIDIGALRLGLSAKCDHCAKENWYGLDDVATTVPCDRCLRSFPFPQGSLPPRDAWKYRVVGPFAVPGFAQGAYAVILSLAFLQRALFSFPPFTYSTSLDLKVGEDRLETDLFAWCGDDRLGSTGTDPLLFVGECKSFGTNVFKAKDVERLRQLGDLLPGAYLVAATLKDVLGEEEQERLRDLCRWGWRRRDNSRAPSRVVVLTGRELFDPDHLHRRQGPEASDAGTIDWDRVWGFDDLAAATQKAHLGFSDLEVSELRYGHSHSS